MNNIIINCGKFGKQDYDANDISIGTDVICVNNPDGYNFSEGSTYHINGMGSLVVDEDNGLNKYRIGFGDDTQLSGYSLTKHNVEVEVDDELRIISTIETIYITYDDLICNFIYSVDHYDDPSIFNMLKRDKYIQTILDE